jgi:hypothetical protein
MDLAMYVAVAVALGVLVWNVIRIHAELQEYRRRRRP